MADEINISPENNRSDDDIKVEDNMRPNVVEDVNKNDANRMNMDTENRNNMGTEVRNNPDANNLTMNNNGTIGDAAAIATTPRTYLILGWISAVFTALISPFFAIPGIIFGVLANKKAKGRGNAVIIVNVILALLFFVAIGFLRQMGFGY